MFRLTWRNFAWAMLITGVLALLVVLTVRFWAYHRIVVEVAEQEARGQAVDRALSARIETLSLRLETVEKEVFGNTPPPAKPATRIVVGPQAWQRNRDKELRARIQALEEWRMRVTQ